jgi:hypothetical protein
MATAVTRPTKKELEAEVARITGQVADKTYTPKWDGTVADVVDDYLASASFERSANTIVSYANALLPVRNRLGRRKAQSITRQDIEQLRDWMLAEGRRARRQAGHAARRAQRPPDAGQAQRGVRAGVPGQPPGRQPVQVRAAAQPGAA